MRKKKSNYQSLHSLLNTSSETFMLVALVSLFALPFVIASNLEPMVKQAETAAQSASITRYPNVLAENSADNNAQLANSGETNNVLGVQIEEQPFEVVEEKGQFGFFDKAEGTLEENSYSLKLLKTKKEFGKISLFKLTNNSSETKEYNLSVVKGKTDSKNSKYLSLNFQEYLIGSPVLPKTVKLEPKEEVWFGVKSSEARSTTDLTINVKLAE